MQENKPILIVGLGIPGQQYERTRHNVGFITVRHFVPEDATWRKEHNALTYAGRLAGHKVIYALPQTFMNNSGDAVRALMAFYKIPLDNLVVIHDDMDLKLGAIREKVGGGSAGHNGIKSIDAAVGADYRRIRIGIGHPRDFDLKMDPADWVLGKFSDEELKQIEGVIQEIAL